MNKVIDISNYESFLVDYYEGNLNSDLKSELLDFIDRHPELEIELDPFIWTDTKLYASEERSFQKKVDLKKHIITIGPVNEGNYQLYASMQMDEELSEDESTALDKFIAQDVSFRNEQEMLLKTKLSADEQLVFRNHEKLKKGRVFHLGNQMKKNIIYSLSIAASLLMLFGIYKYMNQGSNKDVQESSFMASTDSSSSPNHKLNSESKVLAFDSEPKMIPNDEAIDTNYNRSVEKLKQAFPANEKNRNMANMDHQNIDKLIPIGNSILTNYESANSSMTLAETPPSQWKDLPENSLPIDTATIETMSPTYKNETLAYHSNALSLVELGLKGINKLLKRKIRLSKGFDDQNQLASITVTKGNFEISRKVKAKG